MCICGYWEECREGSVQMLKNINITYCHEIVREWIKWTMKRHLVGYKRSCMAIYHCFFKNFAE